MTNITVSISDEVARQAQSAGLLRSETMEQLLLEAMKKRQLNKLFATMDKLAAVEPRLTEEEIDAEIAAARAERARRR